jgi:WD40 repeat protein
MAHDVFISYSRHDKAIAEAVCAKLEEHKVRCWIAPRDVHPGSEWGESIVDAIATTRIMILVFSANANDSPQIRREVERAVNKGVILVPFRIEDVLPTRSLEYFIGAVHWLDALSPPLENHLEKLVQIVQAILSRTAGTEPSAGKAVEVRASPAPESSKVQEVIPSKADAAPPPIAATQPIPVSVSPPVPQPIPPPAAPPPPLREAAQQKQESKVRYREFGESVFAKPAKSPKSPEESREKSREKLRIDFRAMRKWFLLGLALVLLPFGVVAWKLVERSWNAPRFGSDRVVIQNPWDGESAASQNVAKRGAPPQTVLAFSFDGRMLAATANTFLNRFGDVRVVDVETGREIRRFTNDLGPIAHLGFSADGRWLSVAGLKFDATARFQGELRMSFLKTWDVQTGEEVQNLGFSSSIPEVGACFFAFSADGRWIAIACPKDPAKKLHLWDFAASRNPHADLEVDKTTWNLEFSANGEFLTALGHSEQGRTAYTTWETTSGRKMGEISVEDETETSHVGSIDPSGRLLALFSDNPPRVQLCDLATRKSVGNQSMFGYNLAAFSPDGRWLATESFVTTDLSPAGPKTGFSALKMWDISWLSKFQKGRLIAPPDAGVFTLEEKWFASVKLTDAPNDVESFSFSPDWKFLATANSAGVVKIWQRQP